MNAVSLKRMLLLAPSFILFGCKSSRSNAGWCTVSSKVDSQSDDEPIIYSLIFEEHKGVLRARLIDCGGKEFYIGSVTSAKSSDVIPSGYRQSDMRWDGKLSCNDAQATFPEDAAQTKSLLLQICDDLEKSMDSEFT